MENNSSFTNHRHNGVYLQFPNGNAISSIWGVGSYTENHDYKSGRGFATDFSTLIGRGSNTVEIMPISNDDKLLKRIFRKCGKKFGDDDVIGWVDITTWLWIVNQLAKAEGK